MLRHIKNPAFLGVILLVAAVVVSWIYGPQWAREGSTVVLSGSTAPALSDANYVGRSDPNGRLEVIVSLKLRDEDKLDELIQRQGDPQAPEYQQYLTAAQFLDRFGPTQSDVDKVTQYLTSHGLRVSNVSPNRTLITVEGAIGQFEQAFSVNINVYSLNGFSYYSEDRDPRVPVELDSIVESVIGLDNFAQFESRRRAVNQPTAKNTLPTGYSPQQIARAYDFPNANNTRRPGQLTGKGVTVAIASAYNYDPNDVFHYWNHYGITRTGSLTNIHIGGISQQMEGETTLDLQQVGGQAPGADILMYLGNDPSFKTFTKVFNQIVTDNRATIVSISWGLCEKWTGSRNMKAESKIFKQGVAQGIAWFAASGDDGAYDCRGAKTVEYQVDYPSSDPNVTAVGGTSLQLGANGMRASESAWSGSGGGVSQRWARPKWQSSTKLPAGDMRVSADVALVADPWTGYSMYFQGKWEQSGGTSFAAPVWAALWALGSEDAGKSLGPANPTIYRLADSADYGKTFHDITTGNNGAFRGPGYNADADWDHPTGWGVPNASELIAWLTGDARSRR